MAQRMGVRIAELEEEVRHLKAELAGHEDSAAMQRNLDRAIGSFNAFRPAPKPGKGK